MKHSAWIVMVIAAVTLGARAQKLPDAPQPAPTGAADWSRVKDLANGEEIVVSRPGGFGVPCAFAGASDQTLFCESLYGGRERTFDRAGIDVVRRNDKHRTFRIVVGSFAAAGFIWGVATPPGVNGAPRGLNGLAGAAVGGLAGLAVSLPAMLLIPGRLVYRHARPDHGTQIEPVSARVSAAVEEKP
jgi:hypothetical protein